MAAPAKSFEENWRDDADQSTWARNRRIFFESEHAETLRGLVRQVPGHCEWGLARHHVPVGSASEASKPDRALGAAAEEVVMCVDTDRRKRGSDGLTRRNDVTLACPGGKDGRMRPWYYFRNK